MGRITDYLHLLSMRLISRLIFVLCFLAFATSCSNETSLADIDENPSPEEPDDKTPSPPTNDSLSKDDFVGNRHFGTVPIAHLRQNAPSQIKPTQCSEYVDVKGKSESGAEYGLLQSFESSHSYVFHPYEGDSKTPPLFVFYNGGPFSATTKTLLPGGTAPYTATWNSEVLATPQKNAASWADMGNLLYWDGLGTGLGKVTNPLISEGNPLTADTLSAIQTLIRFIQCHDVRNDSPIVLVAESYGAFRGYEMLMMMNAALRENSDEFRIWLSNRTQASLETSDTVANLHGEIRDYYDSVSPQKLDPETRVATIFAGLVLIQPGLSFTKSTKDPHETELSSTLSRAARNASTSAEFSHLFWGTSLSNPERDAYKGTSENVLADTWQYYSQASTPDEIYELARKSGTFITDGVRDWRVDSSGFRDALRLEENDQEEWIRSDDSQGPIISVGRYDAIHAISFYQPQQLHDDVKAWLAKLPQ